MKVKPSTISSATVDQMILMKWHKRVTSPDHPAFVSNSTLGKIYGVDGSSIRRLYLKRFKDLAQE